MTCRGTRLRENGRNLGQIAANGLGLSVCGVPYSQQQEIRNGNATNICSGAVFGPEDGPKHDRIYVWNKEKTEMLSAVHGILSFAVYTEMDGTSSRYAFGQYLKCIELIDRVYMI